MESKDFQLIFNKISGFLPKKWKKLALYFAFSNNMISHKFYVDLGEGYIDCFQLGYEKKDLRQLFFSIEDILSKDRNALTGEKQWNVFTMFVSSTGDFNADFSYDNINDSFIEYQKNWEKNILDIK